MVCPMTDMVSRERMGGVGALIAERRQARGWSQIELAERIGSSQRQISRLENSAPGTLPRRATMDALGMALGITLAEFYRAAGILPPPEAEEPPTVTPLPAFVADAFSEMAGLSDEQIVAYVESQPGASFQARMARQRKRREWGSYVRLCRNIYRAWLSNKDAILAAAEDASDA